MTTKVGFKVRRVQLVVQGPQKAQDGPSRLSAGHRPAVAAREAPIWPILFHMIVDFHGRPLAVVQRLGNPNLVIDPGTDQIARSCDAAWAKSGERRFMVLPRAA